MVTNIEALLIAIFSGVAIISSIMIWKVFDDCRKRRGLENFPRWPPLSASVEKISSTTKHTLGD